MLVFGHSALAMQMPGRVLGNMRKGGSVGGAEACGHQISTMHKRVCIWGQMMGARVRCPQSL